MYPAQWLKRKSRQTTRGGTMKKLWKRLGVGVAALALVGSGVVVASATTPSSTTTYYACVSQLTGIPYNVTTNPAPKCLLKDTVIEWNQVGPAGPAGPAGAPGPSGVTYDCSLAPYPGIDL